MEMDNEVKGIGTSYIFGARIHDPRLGMWLSVDPMAHKYGSFTPYNFAVNNPIIFVDSDGNDALLFLTVFGHVIESAFNADHVEKLREKHPDWPDSKIRAEARSATTRDMIHFYLDAGGALPGVGEVFDLANAGIYYYEGEYTAALLSAGAAVPVAGWLVAGGRAVKWARKLKSGATVTLQWLKRSSGLIEFGNRSALRKILQTPKGMEAHHILPWATGKHDVVQQAAEAGFHMNDFVNGISLTKYTTRTAEGLKGIHAWHKQYNDFVTKRLNDFKASMGNDLTPEAANKFIQEELIPELRTHIQDAIDSGVRLNEHFREIMKNIPGDLD